jgi:hypothetical protein
MINWISSGVEPQRGQYRYVVKETADGTPWILGEPFGNTLKIVGTNGNDLHIGFYLRPGATLEDAHRVAASMNDWIVDTVLIDLGG